MFCLDKGNSIHKPCKPTFDFSIDNLLRKESSEKDVIKNQHNFKHETFTLFQDSVEQISPISADEKTSQTTYNWLSCTRFKPPKIPRSRKRVGCKRYGRGPRIPFAPQQIAVLESTFTSSQYLSSECIHHLAKSLNLTETRVKIWFQNRRARFRRERESPDTISSTDANMKVNSLPMIHSTSGNLSKGNFSTTIPSRMKSVHSTHRTTATNLSSNGNTNKRKLLIPNYLSLQIKNQYQSNPFSLPSNKTNLSTKNSSNVVNSNSISQTMPLNSIHLPYLASMSNCTSEFSLSYANTTAAHLSRILCGTSTSAFAPVTFSFPPSQHK